MKTINSVIFLPFLLILLLVTPVIGSSDWVEYGKSKNGNVHLYNKVSIKLKTEDIVQVWTKMVYSYEGKKGYFQIMGKVGFSTKGWDKLFHSLSLVEIDCKKERYQLLSVTEYDTDDKVLYGHSYDKPKWMSIVFGSMDDTLRKIVCK